MGGVGDGGWGRWGDGEMEEQGDKATRREGDRKTSQYGHGFRFSFPPPLPSSQIPARRRGAGGADADGARAWIFFGDDRERAAGPAVLFVGLAGVFHSGRRAVPAAGTLAEGDPDAQQNVRAAFRLGRLCALAGGADVPADFLADQRRRIPVAARPRAACWQAHYRAPAPLLPSVSDLLHSAERRAACALGVG